MFCMKMHFRCLSHNMAFVLSKLSKIEQIEDYFPKHYNINQVIAVFFICNFKVHILVYSIHVHCSLC